MVKSSAFKFLITLFIVLLAVITICSTTACGSKNKTKSSFVYSENNGEDDSYYVSDIWNDSNW